MKQITQERLQELYSYEASTGVFKSNRTGKPASSLHNGYIRITIDYKDYYAHRLTYLYMTGSLPLGIVDHVNHDKSDNRWSNLRVVNHQENCKNTSLYSSNKSGTTGVYWHDRDKMWTACIYVNGIKKHLGCFECKQDAISARKDANIVYGYHKNHGREVA